MAKAKRAAVQQPHTKSYTNTLPLTLLVGVVSILVAIFTYGQQSGLVSKADVARVDATSLRPGEFLEKYVKTNTPVVITNSQQYTRANAKARFQNLNWLYEDFGDVKVKLSSSRTKVFERVEPSWPRAQQFWKTWLHGEAFAPDQWSSRKKLDRYTPCDESNQHSTSGGCTLFTLDKVVVRPKGDQSTLGDVLSLVNQTTLNTEIPHAYVEYEELPRALQDEMKWYDPVTEFAQGLNEKEIFVGFWVGINSTEAHLHYDANENLFMQLVGSRTWTLFPPSQSAELYESFMLEMDEGTQEQKGHDSNINLSFFTSPVQWDKKDLNRFPLLAKAKPLTVTIQPGEILYLPSYWWHQVNADPVSPAETEQLEDMVTVGINRWFTPAFTKSTPCGSCPLTPNKREFANLF